MKESDFHQKIINGQVAIEEINGLIVFTCLLPNEKWFQEDVFLPYETNVYGDTGSMLGPVRKPIRSGDNEWALRTHNSVVLSIVKN